MARARVILVENDGRSLEEIKESLAGAGLNVLRVDEWDGVVAPARFCPHTECGAIFRTIFEGSPVGIGTVVGPEMHLALANPALCRFLGYTREELANLTMKDISHPDDAVGDAVLLRRLKDGREDRVVREKRFVTRDGRVVWGTLTTAVVRDVEGNVVCGIGVIEDITRRKESEAETDRLIRELREALANVKTLAGLLPICAGCKKIRSDKGYWIQVETYIAANSAATFTHSLCPSCLAKYYPDDAVEPLLRGAAGDPAACGPLAEGDEEEEVAPRVANVARLPRKS